MPEDMAQLPWEEPEEKAPHIEFRDVSFSYTGRGDNISNLSFRLEHGQTLGILVMGILAFACGSAGGVLLAKLMNLFIKDPNKKINPLIGSAGVSAVPMAARVSQDEGRKYDPSNFLLMHAMGPNVAGVVGSAVAAGILLAFFG